MPTMQNICFKYNFFVYESAVYCLLETLVSCLVELEPTFQSDDYWLQYSVFGVCMISGAITFYSLVAITSIFKLPFFTNNSTIGVGADTLFLKIGAAVFAIFAIVLWSIELFLAFFDSVRPIICIIRTCLYIVFNVQQLVFVLNSTRMKFRLPKGVLYFGFAHVLAVNLWTWMSLCVAKSGIHHENEVHHIHFGAVDHLIPWVLHPTDPPIIKNTTFPAKSYKMRAVIYYGDSAITFITFNVQFCLISAAVILSLFISTSSKMCRRVQTGSQQRSSRGNLFSTRSVEQEHVGFNNANTSIGVTCSGIMFIITMLVVAFSGILNSSKYNKAAGITRFAHVLAVNLWTWMSLCVAKSGIHHENEVHHIHFGAVDHLIPWVLHPTDPPIIKNTTFPAKSYKMRAVIYYGDSAITFITFNVQFCLISAAVILSLFISTSSKMCRRVQTGSQQRSSRGNLFSTRSVEQEHVGFNNANTSIGVTCSGIMFIITMLVVAFSGILNSSKYNKAAGITIGTFEIFFYSISIIACLILFGAIQRDSRGNDSNREQNLNNRGVPHQKTINIILLLFGASGEIIFCVVGLIGLMNGENVFDFPGLVWATFFIRIIEVLIQTTLLLCLIRGGSQTTPCPTNGKQSITFLIGLNLILFGYRTVEATIQSVGFPEKIGESHLLFLRIALPLVGFYRFHCSLCFAEIWKSFYDYYSVTALSVRTSRLDLAESPISHCPCSENIAPLSSQYLISPDPPDDVSA